MRFDSRLYRACHAYLGDDRGAALTEPYELVGAARARLPDAPACVYVVGDRDDEVRYVGSVCRARPGALGARLREHLREPAKARTWRRVWVLPVRPSASTTTIRRYEGRVGTRLCPRDQGRLPRY